MVVNIVVQELCWDMLGGFWVCYSLLNFVGCFAFVGVLDVMLVWLHVEPSVGFGRICLDFVCMVVLWLVILFALCDLLGCVNLFCLLVVRSVGFL